MTPEETLHHLKNITTSRTHRSLDAIYDVCKEQYDNGIYDFRISRIALLGEKRGVPKAQTIRNKTGEHYRTLIHSFSKGYTYKKQAHNSSKKTWIDEITDLRIKLLVQCQAAELAEAKRTLNEIIPPNMEIRVYDKQSPDLDYKLNSLEKSALEYLLSEDFLQRWDFHIGEYGDILNANGEKVFKPATIDALKKAILYLE